VDKCFNVPKKLGEQKFLVSTPEYEGPWAKSAGLWCGGAAMAQESFIDAASIEWSSYDGAGELSSPLNVFVAGVLLNSTGDKRD
jgi:hypothetical protein